MNKTNRLLINLQNDILQNNNFQEIIYKIVSFLSYKLKLTFLCFISATKYEIVYQYYKFPNKNISEQKCISSNEMTFNETVKAFYKPLFNINKAKFFLFDMLDIPIYSYNIIYPIFKSNDIFGFILALRVTKKFLKKDYLDFLFFFPYFYLFFLSNKANIEKKNSNIEKQFNSFLEISSLIVSNKNLEETLNILVKLIADVMNYKTTSIMLYKKDKEELEIKATQSLSNEYKNKPNLKIDNSVSGKAIKEDKPISVLDVTKEPLYSFPEIAQKEGLKSLLVVPMKIKSKIIGTINVYTNHEHYFSDAEKNILLSFANLAAIAIENAQLQEESLKAKEALESRKLIERAKGLLMDLYNMKEEEAYSTMRKKAMDLCKPLKDIAEAILISSELNRKN
jgi:putative methionine-R-sulfoxide reductase with GAF domain